MGRGATLVLQLTMILPVTKKKRNAQPGYLSPTPNRELTAEPTPQKQWTLRSCCWGTAGKAHVGFSQDHQTGLRNCPRGGFSRVQRSAALGTRVRHTDPGITWARLRLHLLRSPARQLREGWERFDPWMCFFLSKMGWGPQPHSAGDREHSPVSGHLS